MGRRGEARDSEFGEFVVGCWARLLRTAYLLTGEQQAAEDLVQTSLERTYVAWQKVSRADNPDAYVRRILINIHARRFRRSRVEHVAGPTAAGVVDGGKADQPLQQDQMTLVDDRLALLSALGQLPARQRAVVVLRYWEDLSESQVAAVMQCSTGTVKSQAAKGLAKLRQMPALSDLLGSGAESD
jgi:RNA polymerase sigma-70 factor (sigma-E family)